MKKIQAHCPDDQKAFDDLSKLIDEQERAIDELQKNYERTIDELQKKYLYSSIGFFVPISILGL